MNMRLYKRLTVRKLLKGVLPYGLIRMYQKRRYPGLRLVSINNPVLINDSNGLFREALPASIPAMTLAKLKSGEWSRLIKFGELATRGAIRRETRESQAALSLCRKTKFSFVVPLYNTPIRFLGEMIFSVLEQTYSNWELCLADASDENHDDVREAALLFASRDHRIRYRRLEKNGGISKNTNEAIEMATGDFIVLLDHDDILHPSALFFVAEAIEKKGADFVYTDECTLESKNYSLKSVYFKPEFALDTLRGNNYICHLAAFSRELLDMVGGKFRSEFDGSQDYDMFLRLTEKARHVIHVPKVLYFWRAHAESVAGAKGCAVKGYAALAGAAAIQESLKRNGLPGTVESHPIFPTFYRIRYAITRTGKVSIIIPTKNHVDDLDRCVSSILNRTTWPDFEILIVDNGSTDPAIRNYYSKLADHKNVQVIEYDQPFNFSRINNFAAQKAKGDYLVFLNNDTEVIAPGWIEEMVMYAQRPDIGMVGAKLYYEDGSIQHAGVVVGFGGVAGHAFCKEPGNTPGYMGHAIIPYNYSAVTAACVMVRAEVFREVGGFDESLAVAFNDVDLCLRVLAKGYRNIWTPHAELYHHESKSRGLEDTPEKQMRFKGECERFISRWEGFIEAGDPAYNPNMNLFEAYFTERHHDSVS